MRVTVSLVCFKPVSAPAEVGDEGNGELDGTLHGGDDDALDVVFLFGIDIEVEFVVYLENHLGADSFGTETGIDMVLEHLGGCDGLDVLAYQKDLSN